MKKLLCLVMALLICLAATACSADSYADQEAPGEKTAEYGGVFTGDDYAPAETAAPGEPGEAPATMAQKLIRKVSLSVETEDYKAFIKGLDAAVWGMGGYYEKIESHTSGDRPYATLVIRVPAGRLDELLRHVVGAGNVTYRVESQTDVTLNYVDTESRNKALKTEQERLLALLEQAEDLDQILAIEDRLTEVRYQIESTEASLRTMDNLVDYATVTLELRQVEVYTQVEEPGFWEKIGTGFVSSVKGIWELLKTAFSYFVIALPYLLVFVILPLVILLFFLSRARKRRRKNAPAAPQSADQPEKAEAKPE